MSQCRRAIVFLLAVGAFPAFAAATNLVNTLEIPALTTDQFPGSGANVNRFGGFSDIFYYAPANKWYALPDRGPGGGVLSYENRVEEFSLDIHPTTGAISNFQITRTIPFRTSDGLQPFNGLNPQLLNGSVGILGRSFDPEGFSVGPTGNFYVADEYGPSVYEFAPFDNSGQLEARFVRAFTLLENLVPRNAMGELDYVAASPATGRQGNRGFEGLAINPSGTKLYVTLQSPLRQEGTPNGASSRNGRIYEFDIASGARSAEYLYQFDAVADINANLNDPAGHAFPANQQGRFALSGIAALSDTEFVVIERDSRGSGVANPYVGFDATGTLDDVGIKKIYKISIAGASDAQGSIIAENGGTGGFVPVAKSLYFDVDAALSAAGQDTPEKFEGIAFGPDLADGSKLLLLGIDNDFSATQLAGSTQYDVYTNGNSLRIAPIDDPIHSYAGFDTMGPTGPDLGPVPAGFDLLPINLYSVAVPVPEPAALLLLAVIALAGHLLAIRRRY